MAMGHSGTMAVQERDAQERGADAWKDRLIKAALFFGAGVTLAWCAVIAGSTWWLIERMGF